MILHWCAGKKQLMTLNWCWEKWHFNDFSRMCREETLIDFTMVSNHISCIYLLNFHVKLNYYRPLCCISPWAGPMTLSCGRGKYIINVVLTSQTQWRFHSNIVRIIIMLPTMKNGLVSFYSILLIWLRLLSCMVIEVSLRMCVAFCSFKIYLKSFRTFEFYKKFTSISEKARTPTVS